MLIIFSLGKNERNVKSASRIKTPGQISKPLRRIKSARDDKHHGESAQKSNTGNRTPNTLARKQKAQPEILKYHREKTVNEVPSIDKLNEGAARRIQNTEPALTDGVFGGQCQFCGKPIMTVPPASDFDQDDTEVCLKNYAALFGNKPSFYKTQNDLFIVFLKKPIRYMNKA